MNSCSKGGKVTKRLAFLIRSLEIGGAERQLVALAKGLHQRGVHLCVVTFYSGGALRTQLEQAGVQSVHLGKRGRWDFFRFIIRLIVMLRQERSDIVYGFMPVANIVATMIKLFQKDLKTVWGVRASNMDLSKYDWLSRLSYQMEAALSKSPNLIIANSMAGKKHAVAQGFPSEKIRVIPNGIDTKIFRFDPEGRKKVRAEWNVGDDKVIVGMPARLDPMKDHTTFLRAAARLANVRDCSHVHFVCVGGGSSGYRAELQQLVDALGLSDRILWAGARSDMPAVYSAFDITSSSSYGEGFSNVIAESMACERPCVATNVGDANWIVCDTGRLVSPKNHKALAEALRELVNMSPENRIALGCVARQRIVSEFGVEKMVERTGEAMGLWSTGSR